MRSLAEFQESFLSGVLHRHPSASTDEEEGHRRYRNLVVTNHRVALEDVFPVTIQVVGEDYFKVLAWEYLKGAPPTEPDLNWYGSDFSDFLENFQKNRDELNTLPYLLELARFEWSLYKAGRAPHKIHEPQIVIDELTSVAEREEPFQFILDESLSASRFQFPVVDIWKAHQEEEVKEVKLIQAQSFILVWKLNGDVIYEAVNEQVIKSLELLKSESSFEEVQNSYPGESGELDQIVGYAIQRGWISQVQTNDEFFRN